MLLSSKTRSKLIENELRFRMTAIRNTALQNNAGLYVMYKQINDHQCINQFISRALQPIHSTIPIRSASKVVRERFRSMTGSKNEYILG